MPEQTQPKIDYRLDHGIFTESSAKGERNEKYEKLRHRVYRLSSFIIYIIQQELCKDNRMEGQN